MKASAPTRGEMLEGLRNAVDERRSLRANFVEMFQTLLDVQFGVEHCCPCCGGFNDGSIDPETPRKGHRESCRLYYALREAQDHASTPYYPGFDVDDELTALDCAINYLEAQLDDFRPIEELSSITREPFAIEFKLGSGETCIHTYGSAWFQGGRFDHESMTDCGIRWFRLRGDITEEFPAGRPLEVIPKEGRA